MNRLSASKRICILFVFCATTAIATPAQIFTTLHSFDGTDGSTPEAGLVQGTNGSLYGTTLTGGTNGSGTVFGISPGGALKTLYNFAGTDGEEPFGGVIQGANGKFYGTTSGGGADGDGTVFSLTEGGVLQTLHNFAGVDGEEPLAGVIQGANGKFYGTTAHGGANFNGAVFDITPDGILTTLYSFCPSGFLCPDGESPGSALVQGTNGKFYGTTPFGGASGEGTIFSVTASGTLTTLYSFCTQSNCTDGANPAAALIQGTDGNFYGTTVGGGTHGDGIVFQITPGGTLTVLYSFCVNGFPCTDGYNPVGGLVQGTDGNFYGTTLYGGTSPGDGSVFRITPSGTLTTLHSFCSQTNCADGTFPNAGLTQATNGTFYGTTSGSGADGFGTVFSLSVGLGPFVETNPTSGAVGVPVHILGTNFVGATGVTFNGTPAAFTMVSKTLIKTTVPAGATSGTVEVIGSNHSLSSSVPFRVTL